MLFTVLLAVILSIDCLGVGLSYGMRHMVLPCHGRIIISCCSGVAIALSMFLGRQLEGILPGEQIHLFGESMLVLLGVFFLLRSITELQKDAIDDAQNETVEQPLFQCQIPGLDIIIRIMHNPQHADLDQSGKINGKEALWLGFALAMDSFGAGVFIALMGLSIVWVSTCTLMFAYFLVTLGYHWGAHVGEHSAYRKLKLVPGMMLITLGMIRIILI